MDPCGIARTLPKQKQCSSVPDIRGSAAGSRFAAILSCAAPIFPLDPHLTSAHANNRKQRENYIKESHNPAIPLLKRLL